MSPQSAEMCKKPSFLSLFLEKKRSNNMIFGKKKIRASTRVHDPFFGNLQIWPTFIYRGEVPVHTFGKLPVHALINSPQKKQIQTSTTTHDPFFHKPQI